MKKQLTIKEFGAISGFDYLKASAIISLMVATGWAKEVGRRSEGKGKPSTIYEVNGEMHVKFWNDDGTEFPDEPDTEAVTEGQPEVVGA